MTDFAANEKTIRRQAVIIRSVIILILALISVYIFKRNNSDLINDIGHDTYRSVARIIAVFLASDIILCAGDLFNLKIYILHFVLNSIVSVIAALTVAAITGPEYGIPLFLALQISFVYHGVRSRKFTNQAVAELNRTLEKYNNEAKEKAEKAKNSSKGHSGKNIKK